MSLKDNKCYFFKAAEDMKLFENLRNKRMAEEREEKQQYRKVHDQLQAHNSPKSQEASERHGCVS